MADLVLTFTIPDAVKAELVDAYCTQFGWQSLEVSGPRAAFAKAKAIDLIQGPLKAARIRAAQAAVVAVTVADVGITVT